MTLTLPFAGNLLLGVVLGLAAGLHAASYGAYKDSPHESFLLRRFIRELVFASGLAVALAWARISDGQSAFVVYLSAFALSRIATEFWKLFVRVEPQDDYRIPTQIHWVKGVVHNPALRLLLGLGFLASIYGIYGLATVLPQAWPLPVRGLVVGLSIGLCEGLAGAYKDGSIEGFYWHKFAKSPAFGALGGLIASGHTADPGFLLLAAIGSMRMFLELLFKIVVPDYAPGKFRSMTGPFTRWMTLRRRFLLPYVLTWALYIVLSSHAEAGDRRTEAPAPLPTAAAICESPVSRTVTLQYTVTGRARPLLAWTGRREVGEAWFVSREGGEGRRQELLIGTDPDRAPMRINRWGYVSETSCGDRAELIGVMTESGEQTIEEAHANTAARAGGQVFRAVRSHASSGTVATEVFKVSHPGQATYRDLDGVLALLPAQGVSRDSVRPAGVDAGFLAAVSGLIQETLANPHAESQLRRGLRRTYVYGGRIYDLALTASPHSDPGGTPLLDAAFQIRNRATGRTTDFRVVYRADGPEAGTPIRIVYRPRWWLELELQLQPAAMARANP